MTRPPLVPPRPPLLAVPLVLLLPAHPRCCRDPTGWQVRLGALLAAACERAAIPVLHAGSRPAPGAPSSKSSNREESILEEVERPTAVVGNHARAIRSWTAQPRTPLARPSPCQTLPWCRRVTSQWSCWGHSQQASDELSACRWGLGCHLLPPLRGIRNPAMALPLPPSQEPSPDSKAGTAQSLRPAGCPAQVAAALMPARS